MPRALFLTPMLFLLFSSNIFAGTEVVATFNYQQPNSKLITYSGEVQLPLQGYWIIAASGKPSQVKELYLQCDTASLRKEHPELLKSKLTLQMEKERKIQTGSSLLRSFYSSLEKYVELHEFVGSISLDDLDPIKDKRIVELNEITWIQRYDEKLAGAFAFLVPEFQKYFVVMTCPEDVNNPVCFTVENVVTEKSKHVQWDFAKAQIDERTVIKNLTDARRRLWGHIYLLWGTSSAHFMV